MKKVFFLLFFAAPVAIAMDETVPLPNKEILQERLDSIDVTYFAQRTGIISKLAGQTKTPEDIAEIVDTSISNYIQHFKDNGSSIIGVQIDLMNQHKPHIFEMLLKDAPKALTKLKLLGVYKPKE